MLVGKIGYKDSGEDGLIILFRPKYKAGRSIARRIIPDIRLFSDYPEKQIQQDRKQAE